MEGPVFVEGLPIHIVTSGLDALQGIMDKSYMEITHKQRLTKEGRIQFQLVSYNVKRGSLIIDFDILLRISELALPIIGAINAKTIWDYTKESFKFLKLIYELHKNGHTPQIQQGPNSSVIVVNGDVTYNFNGPVIQIAEKALPHYENLTDLIGEQQVTNIELGTASEPRAIELGIQDKEVFIIPTTIDDVSISLEGEIFDVNKFNRTGKIQVLLNQKIPAARYSFSIVGDQNIVDYIQSMVKQKVKVKCLVERRLNPLGQSVITSLMIAGISS